MVEAKKVSHGGGKQVLAKLVAEGGDPAEIVEREGLAQMSDDCELEAIVERAIEAEPEAAQEVRDGNQKAIGPIVGAVMRETQGARRRGRRAAPDPREARRLMDESGLSLWSQGSYLSIASKNSVLSIGSIGSFGSFCSIGSVGSGFSVASAASFGSAMSAASNGSVMSAAQHGAIMGERDARAAWIAIGSLAGAALLLAAWAAR